MLFLYKIFSTSKYYIYLGFILVKKKKIYQKKEVKRQITLVLSFFS